MTSNQSPTTNDQQPATNNQQPITNHQQPITVLLADDHPIVRDGLRLMISDQPDMNVVAEAATGAETFAQAEAHRPDVVLLDLLMPEVDGLGVLSKLRTLQPCPRVLVLTSYATEIHISAAMKAGADGFQIKDTETKLLLEAIRAVFRGENAMHPQVMKHMVRAYRGETEDAALSTLTRSELDVLTHLGNGLTNQEIADQLNISTRTVSSRIHEIVNKLQLKNRTEAVIYGRDRL